MNPLSAFNPLSALTYMSYFEPFEKPKIKDRPSVPSKEVEDKGPQVFPNTLTYLFLGSIPTLKPELSRSLLDYLRPEVIKMKLLNKAWYQFISSEKGLTTGS